MKLTIDMNDVFDMAMQVMESENDLCWSVGYALQELYPDQVGELQKRMVFAFKQNDLFKEQPA